MAIIHESATLRLTTGDIDLRASEGCFVTVDSSGKPSLAAAGSTPLGVVHVGGDMSEGEPTDIILPNHGGIVGVKLHSSPGTVIPGAKLVLAGNGTVKAGTTGTHVATAVKTGVAGELLEAYLVPPTTLAGA